MRSRHSFGVVLAMLVSLGGSQTVSFAGEASHQATLKGHVGISGHHHLPIKQPPAVKAVPTLNVRDFGATGNGVTDDTAAIQNCINAAQAGNEGVLFPAGTYLHASVITANGVPLFGVGGASTLLANNPTSTAVILTGVSPSIQNIIVSSAQASSGATDLTPTHATLLVEAAQNFVVQGITVVQGTGRVGTFLQQSAVGNVSSVTYNGTGSNLDDGILMDGCTDVSLLGNLLLNESTSIQIGGLSTFLNNSIAVIGNSISTSVASPVGIFVLLVVVADVAQNQIQMPSTGTGTALFIAFVSSTSITQNVTSGGQIGLNLISTGLSNVATQNIIRNCGSIGAIIQTGAGTGNVAFESNLFGECGITGAGAVIDVIPGVGPNDVTLTNNVYAGHANMLTDFMASSAHLNFVSGNTQTQTALPNAIP